VAAYREDSGTTDVNGDEADDSAADSGAVYVFTRTLLVGAALEHESASDPLAEDPMNSGALYDFARSGGRSLDAGTTQVTPAGVDDAWAYDVALWGATRRPGRDLLP
jgi:hypothetical protein